MLDVLGLDTIGQFLDRKTVSHQSINYIHKTALRKKSDIMPKDKSQLDIYQIERESVVTEICKSIAPEEQAQLTELLEVVTAGEPTPESINELSETIIRYIIRTQNNKPKALHYESIALSPNTVQGYTLMLYEARSCPQSPIAAILQGRLEQAPQTGVNVSHVLFAYDRNSIYAVCSGSGWQVVTPFANSQFGLNVLSRLIPSNEEAICSARYRGFAGAVAAQDTSYRRKARASEVAEFGRLFKDLSGQISAETIHDELGIDVAGNRRYIGADFKNTFKIRKSISLLELGELFEKITELLKEDPLFSIEDWLGIVQLGKNQRERMLCQTLTHEALASLCKAALDDDADRLEVFVCDPKGSIYLTANSYKVSIGSNEFVFDEFNSEEALFDCIRQLSMRLPEGSNREEELVQMLSKAMLYAYSEGNTSPDTSTPLTKCLQLSVVYQRRNYIFIEGEWYTVYDGLNAKLNRELPKLVSNRLSKISLPAWEDGVLEDKYLDLLSNQCGHAKLHRRQPLDRVELCDTVIVEGKRVVFCHVKEGFNTTMRVLTSQVRSSANILADLRAGNRLTNLQATWQHTYRDIPNIPPWEIVEKAILGTDGYSVAECTIFHPDNDVSTSVEWSDSVIAKYELSTLLKGWEYEFPIEIAIPCKTQ